MLSLENILQSLKYVARVGREDKMGIGERRGRLCRCGEAGRDGVREEKRRETGYHSNDLIQNIHRRGQALLLFLSFHRQRHLPQPMVLHGKILDLHRHFILHDN